MGLADIHSLLIERMMAVADEIFDSVKDNMIEYEREIERLKLENYRLRNQHGCSDETRHDELESYPSCHTDRDGVLPGLMGSDLSEIRVKLEVAHVMCHEPLSQASTSPSSISPEIPDTDRRLSLLPVVLLKKEDLRCTDSPPEVTVKQELCDNEPGGSISSAAQTENNLHLQHPLAEQDCKRESFEEVSQRRKLKHQNMLCKVCGKCFRTRGHLQKHLLVHQTRRPYCCASCGKLFKSKYNLKEHQRIHSGDYRYSCLQCGKGFSRSNNLKRHFQISQCQPS